MSAIGAVRDKRQGALALLGSRRFGPLFATQFLSAFNDNTLRNALVLMIAYRADTAGQFSAQIMIPLAAGLFRVPFFLCSATAGLIADEEDKAWLIRLIIAVGLLLCNRLLGGRLGLRYVAWGALGIALFSIDLWLASPAIGAAGELATFGAFLRDPAHWRILADLFGIAASGGIFVVPLYTLLQTATDREHRARAIAANNIANAAAMVISSAATMARFAVGISIPGLFLLTGGATLAVAVLFWRVPPRFGA